MTPTDVAGTTTLTVTAQQAKKTFHFAPKMREFLTPCYYLGSVKTLFVEFVTVVLESPTVNKICPQNYPMK
ncbi:unnamed protein product [Allacma fusca]|uniref:Uncharacterized protein n=1 Tax=Allacma fusca TaxID=39272 RepID=A0A8J2PCX1_9HEXA|nr:unnamed protein product [Allacma fusca]